MANNVQPGKQSLTRRDLIRLGFAASAAGLAVLAGCAPSAAPSPTAKPAAPAAPATAPASPPAAAAKPTAAPQPTAAPAQAKKVSITYWSPLDHKDTSNARSKAEIAMVDLFRKKYPNIEVNVQTVPWQTIDKQIIQAAQAGKAPDVAQPTTQGVPLLAPSGVLVPLNDWVGKWPKEQRDDFVMPWENVTYGGNILGLYWNSIANTLLYYRKDLLDAKGLAAPKNWDDLVSTAKAVNEGRVNGFLVGLSKDGNAVQFTIWLTPTLWSLGADWLDDQGQVAFNNEAGQRAFQFLYDLVHQHKVAPEGIVSMTRDNMLDSFKAGTLAMTNLSSNTVSAARASGVGKTMGLARSPGVKEPLPSFTTGKFIVMTKDSKEKEAAWLFIQEQVSPEAQVINAKIATELPARASVLKDPWFQTPEAADIKFQVEYMQSQPRKFQYHPKNNVLADMVAGAAQAIIAKQTTIKAALDDVAKRWAEEVKS